MKRHKHISTIRDCIYHYSYTAFWSIPVSLFLLQYSANSISLTERNKNGQQKHAKIKQQQRLLKLQHPSILASSYHSSRSAIPCILAICLHRLSLRGNVLPQDEIGHRNPALGLDDCTSSGTTSLLLPLLAFLRCFAVAKCRLKSRGVFAEMEPQWLQVKTVLDLGLGEWDAAGSAEVEP